MTWEQQKKNPNAITTGILSLLLSIALFAGVGLWLSTRLCVSFSVYVQDQPTQKVLIDFYRYGHAPAPSPGTWR